MKIFDDYDKVYLFILKNKISLYDLDILVCNILCIYSIIILAINDILLQEYKVVFSKKFGLNNLCITTYEIEPAVLIEGLEINHINPSYIKLPIEYFLLINSFPYQYCSNIDEKNDIINFKYISAPSITGYRVLYLYI